MDMKKVLFIEPGTTVIYPPMGLMHLASAIRDKYTVKIKDYSGIEIKDDELEKLIRDFDPFVIGLRVLTGPSILRALKISKIAKKLGKKVIWGGPHPTILPEQTLENKYIDAVCIGEGEYAIVDLLKYFEGKKKTVLGCGLKINSKIKIFPPQKKFVDFNHLPLPSWDLLEDINRYFPDKKENVLSLSTTRGCPFKCGFCHNSHKNVKAYQGCYRIAEPKRAIEEYKFVQKLIKNEIGCLDVGEDLHLVSYDYAKKFCDAMKSTGSKKLKWTTAAKYAILNEKIIDLISKNNCKSIMMGIESGSKRIQEINGKVIDLNRARHLARLLRKKGLFVRNTYIFGHPTETEEELKMTLDYIKKIPADENLIQLYRPMPGTPYFDLCLKENKIKEVPKKIEDWYGFGVLGHDINISRVPSGVLFSTFYKTNAIEQSRYWFNQQKYFLRENMYMAFLKNFVKNRFTHKLNEYLQGQKDKYLKNDNK